MNPCNRGQTAQELGAGNLRYGNKGLAGGDQFGCTDLEAILSVSLQSSMRERRSK